MFFIHKEVQLKICEIAHVPHRKHFYCRLNRVKCHINNTTFFHILKKKCLKLDVIMSLMNSFLPFRLSSYYVYVFILSFPIHFRIHFKTSTNSLCKAIIINFLFEWLIINTLQRKYSKIYS